MGSHISIILKHTVKSHQEPDKIYNLEFKNLHTFKYVHKHKRYSFLL
jgi:hypothetical protein